MATQEYNKLKKKERIQGNSFIVATKRGATSLNGFDIKLF
jgi:hypothetical protein